MQAPRTAQETAGRCYQARLYTPDSPLGGARRHTLVRGLGRGEEEPRGDGQEWASLWLPGVEVYLATPLCALGPWSLAAERRLAQDRPPFDAQEMDEGT